MAKVDAGALSFGASGTIGGTMTFSSWKGRPYVRRRVIPSNPKSGGQVGVRAGMRWGSRAWAGLSGAQQATWETPAAARAISPFNAFVSVGQQRIRNNLTYQQSNPAETAADPAAVTGASATASVRTITLAWTDSVTAGAWNVHIYRGLATGFATAPSNLLAIVDAGVEQYVDSPLTPDEYFYILIPGNIEGELSTNTVEVSDTVTE